MKFELTILGTSAAVPYRDRYLAAQILNIQEQLFLIDCGEGTQFQMMKFHVKKMKINQIFISHLHGDHFFGLFGVLTSMAMMGRKNAVEIFAPAGLEEIVKVVFQNSKGPVSKLGINYFMIKSWSLNNFNNTLIIKNIIR